MSARLEAGALQRQTYADRVGRSGSSQASALVRDSETRKRRQSRRHSRCRALRTFDFGHGRQLDAAVREVCKVMSQHDKNFSRSMRLWRNRRTYSHRRATKSCKDTIDIRRGSDVILVGGGVAISRVHVLLCSSLQAYHASRTAKVMELPIRPGRKTVSHARLPRKPANQLLSKYNASIGKSRRAHWKSVKRSRC